MSPRQFYKPKNTKTMQAQKSEIELMKISQEGLTYKFYCMPLFEASLTNQNIGITECDFVDLTRPHHL